MNVVTIDFETRSPVNLKTHGLNVYFEHPDTEIMCLGLALNSRPPVLWTPPKFYDRVDYKNLRYKLVRDNVMLRMIKQADAIVAQNSMFEVVGWHEKMHKGFGFPDLELEKMHDTMAQLGYHALPFNLAQAGQALNLPIQKDPAGHKLMLKMCKPRNPRKGEPVSPGQYLWHETQEQLEGLLNYCGQDVESERLLYNSLAPLPPFEREIWLLDQCINLRGVPIDMESVRAIVEVIEQREKHLLRKFKALTKGRVSGPRSYVALKDWINKEIPWAKINSVGKDETALLMADRRLPEYIREVLKIKAEISKSSVAKFKAMLNRASKDGRVRDWALYAGASTLRWASQGLQNHNHPRDSYGPETYEHAVGLFKEKDLEGLQLLYDDPYFVASRCVRGSIQTKPGSTFVCADYSSVEAVGTPYLAEDEPALVIFRSGRDVYKVAAADTFNCSESDIGDSSKERQIGKVQILALGFGGGIGAFANMAINYGIDLESLPAYVMPYATPDELEGQYGAKALAKTYISQHPEGMSFEAAVACDVIKRKWRAAHPAIVQFWRDLEDAAYAAVQNPGQIFSAGRIRYCVHGKFLKCQMPSGRLMHYYMPRIQPVRTSWGEDKKSITYMGLKVVDGKTTRQWVRLHTYGGKLCENVVQGFCRDLLACGMLRVEKELGYPIVLHVHDEAAAELPDGAIDLKEFETTLSKLPDWAYGMPLKAKGWVGRRYRK
jgi:DNA polymerase